MCSCDPNKEIKHDCDIASLRADSDDMARTSFENKPSMPIPPSVREVKNHKPVGEVMCKESRDESITLKPPWYVIFLAGVCFGMFIMLAKIYHDEESARCRSMGGQFAADKCFVNGVER